jgi:cytochrome c-type biogenesis protein CcmE
MSSPPPFKSRRFTRKQTRLMIIATSLGVLGIALGLVLLAMRDSIVFFHAPTDVVEKAIPAGTRFRLGGLVQEGSITRGLEQRLNFIITDTKHHISVTYQGTVPDLFREKQGVVAEGKLGASGRFVADTILAKHDENYMPREVADALKKQGHWVPPAARPSSSPP